MMPIGNEEEKTMMLQREAEIRGVKKLNLHINSIKQ